MQYRSFRSFALLLFTVSLVPALAAQVSVRFQEGLLRGFLVLRSPEGNIIANGDLLQTAQGSRVTRRLVFHFKDGSLYDETVVCSQRRVFRVLSDHLVQKGPAFRHPLDMTLNARTGQVVVRYTDDDGKPQVASEHMNLPADLTNGILFILLNNLPPGQAELKLSMVVSTPKPRLVKLALTAEGEEPFLTGDITRKALHYRLKVEVGGIAGLVAPLIGQGSPDIHVWVLAGEAPAFVKFEGPLFAGGPVWRIELTSPTWKAVASSQ